MALLFAFYMKHGWQMIARDKIYAFDFNLTPILLFLVCGYCLILFVFIMESIILLYVGMRLFFLGVCYCDFYNW